MTLLNRNGQIFSIDLMLASIIFLLILTTATIYSNHIANRIYFLEQDAEMRQAGQQAANGLVLTGGNPANWQNQGLKNVNSIGIASSANNLKKNKMQRLSSLASSNYEEVKDILGIAKFDFKIDVISMKGNFVVESFGARPESESSIVSINRIAFYDGNNVVVRLKVFK